MKKEFAPSASAPSSPVALVTGAARRIGAEIVSLLHQRGYTVILHYRHSATDAQSLYKQLEARRPGSMHLLQGDLHDPATPARLAEQTLAIAQRLDLLVNNASGFRPTPVGTATLSDWNELIDSNLKAAFFLSQALAPALRESSGCIINISDAQARRALTDHAIYGMAKAGLDMMTRSLARDLAPEVRVNGVAPGAILWPENGMSSSEQQRVLDVIPLGRLGKPVDIAEAVFFLSRHRYITGQTLKVDGGRSLI